MKPTQDTFGGHNLWDIEIEYLTGVQQVPRDKARSDTIMRWMELGNLHPLGAAIAEGHALSADVLTHLGNLIPMIA
jgi:hypothetical protein